MNFGQRFDSAQVHLFCIKCTCDMEDRHVFQFQRQEIETEKKRWKITFRELDNLDKNR